MKSGDLLKIYRSPTQEEIIKCSEEYGFLILSEWIGCYGTYLATTRYFQNFKDEKLIVRKIRREHRNIWFPDFLLKTKNEIRLEKLKKILLNDTI